VSVNRAAIIADADSENAISKLSIDDPKKEATEFLKVPQRQWTAVGASPDGRLLSATYRSPGGGRTVVIEPDSKSELGAFPESIFVWTKPTNFLLFDWLDPSELVQIVKNGKVRSIKKFGRFNSDTSGRAFDLTGQVASDDGARAWATYRKGPALLEFTLASRKIKTLIGGPSGAYALSVSTPDGLLLTGGADGYVRLWKLEDFSLSKEYSVAPPDHFVTTVHLIPGGRQAIVGVKEIIKEQGRIFPADPTEVILLDLETGERKKVLDVNGGRVNIDLIGNQLIFPEGDRVKLVTIAGQPIREFTAKAAILQTAVSDNGQWLAVFDSSQTLTIFEIQTGKQIVGHPTKADDAGPAVVTNDGRFVYKLAHGGELIRWDMQTGELTKSVLARVREMSSNVDFITLANNDEWLITAGNHGDVGIFDRATGSLVNYTQTSATAFWVEKVWVSGDRMILTTDTGVMFDGRLIK
jgi:WD40 repeat protein